MKAISCGFKVSAAASVGASVLRTEVSPGHPHPVIRTKTVLKETSGQLFFVAELAASSPKRSLWEMQRGEDGAAVKVSVPLQGTKKLWEPQEKQRGQSPLGTN